MHVIRHTPVILADLELVHVGQVVDCVARDLAEDGVPLVEPVRPVQRDEELAAVGVRCVGVGTRHKPPAQLSTLCLCMGCATDVRGLDLRDYAERQSCTTYGNLVCMQRQILVLQHQLQVQPITTPLQAKARFRPRHQRSICGLVQNPFTLTIISS